MTRIAAVLLVAAGCTGSTTVTTSTPPATTPPPTVIGCLPGDLDAPGCPAEVQVGNTTYWVECLPVAEALVDVDLPHRPGQLKVKAIAGLAAIQAVAVRWSEPDGCGMWALALAAGLSADVSEAVREEVAAGVGRFGVTASPAPNDVAGD